MACKGVSPYCQECGACAASAANYTTSIAPSVAFPVVPSPDNIVDLIVNRVTQTVRQEMGVEDQYDSEMMIPLGVSNRHLHVTPETFAELFGADAEFEVYRDLYEPGEFASKHTVTILGPKMKPIQNVRILGPFRNYDQVEISLTDAVSLGISPPIGDLANGAPLTIVGPKGSIHREHIAVIANRHIHMSPSDAHRFGVKNGDYCKVRIPGVKGLVLENVLIRTHKDWKLMLHLDTDDANAAHVICGTKVEFFGKM